MVAARRTAELAFGGAIECLSLESRPVNAALDNEAMDAGKSRPDSFF
jgi:hypothetical protein